VKKSEKREKRGNKKTRNNSDRPSIQPSSSLGTCPAPNHARPSLSHTLSVTLIHRSPQTPAKHIQPCLLIHPLPPPSSSFSSPASPRRRRHPSTSPGYLASSPTSPPSTTSCRRRSSRRRSTGGRPSRCSPWTTAARAPSPPSRSTCNGR
jgi:hypothetical protein